MEFGRLLTAMVTAFDVKGQLDLQRQTNVIDHLYSTGTDAIVVAGTTGESPTLTKDEKIQLIKHTVQQSKGRGKVIVGTGSNNTKETVELTEKVTALGVDGIMLVNPYYNRPSQEGLYQHFKAVAESTMLPIMLYNIPGRSAVNMSVDTVVRLSKIPNIKMIKEASGDLGQVTEILNATSQDFQLYSGDDNLTLPILAVGGKGVVSVASHVIGKEMKQMINAYDEGDVSKASRLHRELYPKMRALFAAPSPAPLKRVLEEIGVSAGPVRLPLVALNKTEEAQVLSHFSF
ncbi:4-hydroxy-tetrahydrodipicolinate synthase [Caldalkalibacillus salinus]|uniref:4-hydroxy-tetrahydrodipicolinate synthase n=1 Tax=Caldalkalibacillus salinus TaxID=2803787 RepID=UPI0030180FFC